MPVKLIDSSQASLDKGLKFADKLLEKDVGKQRITKDEATAARERLSPHTSLEDLSDVDFVIEAVPVRDTVPTDLTSPTKSLNRRYQTSKPRFSPSYRRYAHRMLFLQRILRLYL